MELKIIILFLVISIVTGRELIVDYLRPNPVTDLFDFGTLRITRVKRNHFTVSGNVALKSNTGNEVTLVLEMVTEKGSTMFKKETKVCEFVQSEKMFYPQLVKVSNFPDPPPCPYPKGNYTIRNYELDEKKFLAFPPGKYIARLSAFEDKKKLSELEVGLTATPF